MVHALTFNPEDGNIHIDGCNFVVRNGLTEADVKLQLHEFLRSESNHQNGYAWQMCRGFSLERESAGLALCFHLDRLIAVHVGVTLPGIRLEGGWPTKAAIDQEVAFLRTSLGRQLARSFQGSQEEFSWGTAWVLFDAKGFLASAGIRYKN